MLCQDGTQSYPVFLLFSAPPVETKPVKIFSCVTGKTLGSHEDFVRSLCRRRATLQEVPTVEECDVVLVFCPVVSRAGTDIEAALQKLSDIPGKRHAANRLLISTNYYYLNSQNKFLTFSFLSH